MHQPKQGRTLARACMQQVEGMATSAAEGVAAGCLSSDGQMTSQFGQGPGVGCKSRLYLLAWLTPLPPMWCGGPSMCAQGSKFCAALLYVSCEAEHGGVPARRRPSLVAGLYVNAIAGFITWGPWHDACARVSHTRPFGDPHSGPYGAISLLLPVTGTHAALPCVEVVPVGHTRHLGLKSVSLPPGEYLFAGHTVQ